MSLKSQVAIVTGASSGIGAAVARDLNQAGVKLVLTARRAALLNALAAELTEAVAIPGDIRDPDFPQRLLDRALSEFGRCDIVVNNAGAIEVGPIEEIDVDRVCDMVRVNVEAAFRLAYVALKHFKAVGRGHLVNTSSVLGTKVRPTAGCGPTTSPGVCASSWSSPTTCASRGSWSFPPTTRSDV